MTRDLVTAYFDKSIATYDGDPPANDYQRGHRDALKVARAELASLLAAQALDDRPESEKWKPRDTAPRDGSTFLTFMPDAESPFDFAFWDAEFEEFIKHGCGWQYVTQWRPIIPPEPTS